MQVSVDSISIIVYVLPTKNSFHLQPIGILILITFISGELSEEQKEQLEKNRALIVLRDSELMESRQQLAKLSTIIDQQATEIKAMSTEIRWVLNFSLLLSKW